AGMGRWWEGRGSDVATRRGLVGRVALWAAVVAVCWVAGAGAARAEEGFFDFLFGGPGHWQPPWRSQDHAPPVPGVGRVAPAALGNESVSEGGGTTGHGVAFCVRLWDGHHFT